MVSIPAPVAPAASPEMAGMPPMEPPKPLASAEMPPVLIITETTPLSATPDTEAPSHGYAIQIEETPGDPPNPPDYGRTLKYMAAGFSEGTASIADVIPTIESTPAALQPTQSEALPVAAQASSVAEQPEAKAAPSAAATAPEPIETPTTPVEAPSGPHVETLAGSPDVPHEANPTGQPAGGSETTTTSGEPVTVTPENRAGPATKEQIQLLDGLLQEASKLLMELKKPEIIESTFAGTISGERPLGLTVKREALRETILELNLSSIPTHQREAVKALQDKIRAQAPEATVPGHQVLADFLTQHKKELTDSLPSGQNPDEFITAIASGNITVSKGIQQALSLESPIRAATVRELTNGRAVLPDVRRPDTILRQAGIPQEVSKRYGKLLTDTFKEKFKLTPKMMLVVLAMAGVGSITILPQFMQEAQGGQGGGGH